MPALTWLAITIAVLLGTAVAQTDHRIDLRVPDAPELAAPGGHAVGVRTLEVVDPGRIDVLDTTRGAEARRYDRPLTLEVWYPADLPDGAIAAGTYDYVTRDGTPSPVKGRAVRDAEPAARGAPYPLVVLSHGYPGHRLQLAHFGEHLASHGYVVVSIDHTESTFADQAAFASTLYHRPLDQGFVVDEMARRAAAQEGFVRGLVDASRTGIIGYSMGGYGLLNLLGAGFTEASTRSWIAPPNGLLSERQAGHAAFEASIDPRIRAGIAIAPWGMPMGFWDAEGLSGIETPVLFMAGSADDVSGYARGARVLFEGAVHAERYLLTFEHAGHDAAALNPLPGEAWDAGAYGTYAAALADIVWRNNVAQHFATAFLGVHLQGDEAMARYLDPIEEAADPTDWLGFVGGTAVDLRFERRAPVGR
jgi:predicted dienelactone hydrolase